MISHKQCRRRAGTPLQLQRNKYEIQEEPWRPRQSVFSASERRLRQTDYSQTETAREHKQTSAPSFYWFPPMTSWRCGGTEMTEDVFGFVFCKVQHLSSLMGRCTEFTGTSKWRKRIARAVISCHRLAGRDGDSGIKWISVTIMCLRQRRCGRSKIRVDREIEMSCINLASWRKPDLTWAFGSLPPTVSHGGSISVITSRRGRVNGLWGGGETSAYREKSFDATEGCQGGKRERGRGGWRRGWREVNRTGVCERWRGEDWESGMAYYSKDRPQIIKQ